MKVGAVGLSSPFHFERKVAFSKPLHAPMTVSVSDKIAILASLKVMSLSSGKNL
ncbi:MAG: hypothetical protein Q4F54_01340 [Coriobacteriia bacterium]|nr:hypothetical protein [Coriobacteriia bacterium]